MNGQVAQPLELLTEFKAIIAALTAPDGPCAVVDVVVRGKRRRAFAGAAENVSDLYERARCLYGDRDLLIEDGRHITYEEVFARAARLGAALRQQHCIQPGDRVGLVTRNCSEWFVAFVAITRIGAIATLINSRGSADEMTVAAAQVECRLVIADDRCAERLTAGGNAIPVLTFADVARLIDAGGSDLEAVRVDTDAPVVILFTSGTTGRPKGATLTHRNFANMTGSINFVGVAGLTMTARRMGVDVATLAAQLPRLSALMIFPVFHVSGLTNLFSALFSGGQLVLLRRWDPAEAISLIERHRVTAVAGPSMVLADLLDQPNAAARLQSLSSVVIGGQATPLALAERVREMLPRITQGGGWGMTELTGVCCNAPGAINRAFPGSCGVPSPHADVHICAEDGTELPAGAVGEIWVRSPMVMHGYWDDPEATAQTFHDDWLKTGDLAYVDEHGLLYIVDRQKDMVISAGENIYCAEIERILSTVPDQVEVAMFGVPDERLGERAIAVVVARPGASLDPEAIKAIVRASVADYKVPTEVVLDLGPLPRNDLGKVDKRALRERYLARAGN